MTRNWSEAVRYSSSAVIRTRIGCLPTHPGHIQVLEKAHLFGDPGERLETVEGDLTGGQGVPQIGTFHGSTHGPHQRFRSVGMDIQPGRRPLRQRPATIGCGHLPVVELFEDLHLSSG